MICQARLAVEASLVARTLVRESGILGDDGRTEVPTTGKRDMRSKDMGYC